MEKLGIELGKSDLKNKNYKVAFSWPVEARSRRHRVIIAIALGDRVPLPSRSTHTV
ncbi:hypothetical protein [Spirulina major]|uniref:hypothetical protein n=1 Tax=Spirulina major TaxID=270636 RepID=UPI001587A441|nr:hypothetical protein [Spirulina major]